MTMTPTHKNRSDAIVGKFFQVLGNGNSLPCRVRVRKCSVLHELAQLRKCFAQTPQDVHGHTWRISLKQCKL